MSQNQMTGNHNQASCQEVLNALIFFIDDEIHDSNQLTALQVHFQQCPPCLKEMEHERKVIAQMKKLLTSACFEEAPEELQARIAAQTALLAAQMSAPTQIVTEYRQSQTTVYSDEFGGIRIEETHIEIQSTNEFGGDFPLA